MNKSQKIILQTNGLSRSFDGAAVISELSLSLQASEHYTLFAPSGAGKTTLLRLLLGLDKKYTGSIELMINPEHLAVIFQRPALLPHRNVKDNLCYAARLKKRNRQPGFSQLFNRWVEVCSLEDYLHYYPYQISAGMKQKVAVARAFLTEPELLLMDEPFSSIDLYSKKRIAAFITEHHPAVTTVTVTHNLDDLTLFNRTELLFFKGRPLSKPEKLKLRAGDTTSREKLNRLITASYSP